MPGVRIMRQSDGERTLPVFLELNQRLDAVRQRAYDLFSMRGRRRGDHLADWVTAEREVLGFAPGEVKERDAEYEVNLALPGFTADDVELTATPNELIIHAEKRTEQTEKRDGVVWSEFGGSEVYRRVLLPSEVTTDAVSAELVNGVLKVRVPKTSPAVAPSAAKDAIASSTEEARA